MRRYLPWLLAIIGLWSAVMGCAAEPEWAWPEASPEQLKEDVFGVRFRQTREIDGPKAGLDFLRREYQRSPQPYVKAYYAWVCLFAEAWGYPEMKDEALGLRLAAEAVRAGSVVARDVLARAKGRGVGGPENPPEAARLLTEAAASGATRSMARLAYYQAIGYGMPADPVKGDRLARQAAELGMPLGLVEIGQAYESGTIGGRPDLGRAMAYYYEASCHAEPAARDKLLELQKQKVPQADLYHSLGYVRDANRAHWIAPSRVREQVQALTGLAGDHPEALVELGCAHLDGVYARRDHTVARDYLNRAAAKGQIEAKFFLQKMRLRGWGEKAAPAEALAEIHALAGQGSLEAANYLGYLYYWAPSEAPGLEQSREKAFHYVRKAATGGHPFGVMNLAYCYENGIGTPVNYALAAKIYWQAYTRGFVKGRDKVRRLMAFVKES